MKSNVYIFLLYVSVVLIITFLQQEFVLMPELQNFDLVDDEAKAQLLERCKHPIKDDYPGCWGVATFASNTKSHDDKGRGRPGDCLLRRAQDQLPTAPV